MKTALLEVEGLTRSPFQVGGGLFRRGRSVVVKAVDGVSFAPAPAAKLSALVPANPAAVVDHRPRDPAPPEPTAAASSSTEDVLALDKERLRGLPAPDADGVQDPLAFLNPRMSVGPISGDSTRFTASRAAPRSTPKSRSFCASWA